LTVILSLAAGEATPRSAAAANPAVPVTPTVTVIGDDNALSAADLDALAEATNPPVFISNLSTALPTDLSYLAVQMAADAQRRTEYNYVTCSYGISNWWSGETTGTGDWNSTELFTAHVKGADTALGISTQSKSSSASAEVGLWLVTERTWPASSSVTVDFRWVAVPTCRPTPSSIRSPSARRPRPRRMPWMSG
jgi:hypothetical protein